MNIADDYQYRLALAAMQKALTDRIHIAMVCEMVSLGWLPFGTESNS